MSIQIEPVSDAVGAEIKGLDCHVELDAATVAELRAAWIAHGVLFFRGQDLTDGEHSKFCANFGAIQAERTSPESESEEQNVRMQVKEIEATEEDAEGSNEVSRNEEEAEVSRNEEEDFYVIKEISQNAIVE